MIKNTQKDKKEPPLPKDKPATYENKGKGVKANATGNRRNKAQPEDKTANANPQKTREKLEYDPEKRERNPKPAIK